MRSAYKLQHYNYGFGPQTFSLIFCSIQEVLNVFYSVYFSPQSLALGPLAVHEVSQMFCNKQKNRFANIFPCAVDQSYLRKS